MRLSPRSTIPDAEIRYEAVRVPPAIGNSMPPGRRYPPCSPRTDTDKALLLAAIEAAAAIRPREAEPLLAELTDSDEVKIADAADNAMMMATRPFDDEFDDDSEL